MTAAEHDTPGKHWGNCAPGVWRRNPNHRLVIRHGVTAPQPVPAPVEAGWSY